MERRGIFTERKRKKRWKIIRIIFAILIILLFLGVVITIAIGNIDKISILWKTP